MTSVVTTAPVRPQRTPRQERVERKRQLVAALQLFSRFGFDEGAGGHITARDPEDPDKFWINPFGVNFAHVRMSDLLQVDAAGAVVAGTGRINPAGYTIHARIHASRPDVVAAAHSHSVHGRAWATLGRQLDPITQDACVFFEDHAVYDGFGGVVLDADEGRQIAERLGGNKAVILQNHGLLTVGTSVQEAAWWFIAMERCCQVQLLAEAAGTPRHIPAPIARATARMMGTPAMARLNFRPLYVDVQNTSPQAFDEA
ncbi:class II aldolase/adducin family protein [Dactylosporangium sp. CS-047395]|uniref:class II aldolase/adducin family protein n=1 Tax=Dactylosporangium sp. CS-047395 TaxID=3239936 RepID=UPI003D89EDB1